MPAGEHFDMIIGFQAPEQHPVEIFSRKDISGRFISEAIPEIEEKGMGRRIPELLAIHRMFPIKLQQGRIHMWEEPFQHIQHIGTQRISTGFVPGIRILLKQGHMPSRPSQAQRTGQPGGTSPPE